MATPAANAALVASGAGAAVVTIGTVTTDDSNAAFHDDGTDDLTVYTDYQVKNRYYECGQKYMLPLATPTPFQGRTVAFVQLASPTLLWVARWTALRTNQPPVVPSQVSVDPRWIFLDKEMETMDIKVAPDGTTPLYRISGTYIYGHTNPGVNTLGFMAWALPPWLDDLFGSRNVGQQIQTATNILTGQGGGSLSSTPNAGGGSISAYPGVQGKPGQGGGSLNVTPP